MAKQRFDESKVTRGPDGRFIAQGGAVELRMTGPNRYGGPNYGNYNSSSPGQERLLQINQNGLDMLNQLQQQQNRPRQNYQNQRDMLNKLTSSKPSRRRGSVA